MKATTRTLTVDLYAGDPISRNGITAALEERAFEVVSCDPDGDPPETDRDSVALLVVEEVDDRTGQLVRQLRHNGVEGIVVIATTVDDHGLIAAVEAGASGLLRRSDATIDRIATAIRDAARGAGSLPPDLLGRLMDQVSHLQDQVLAPRGMHLHGLSEREIEVLRLVAEGHPTSEIAQQMSYSERTIKNVIHGITSRLQLKNRSHAVAYALRNGLI